MALRQEYNEYGAAGGGFAGGLAQGLMNMMKYKLDKEEALRMQQQEAWAENPNNPENQERSALAKSAMAQSEQRGSISMRDLAAAAGYNLPASFKAGGVMIPSTDAPAFLEKLASLKGSQAQRDAISGGGQGGQSTAAGPVPLDPAGEKLINDITMEMGGLKNAFDTGAKGGVFNTPGNHVGNAENYGANLILGLGADKLPGVGPMLTPDAGKQYQTSIQDAMFRVAKVLSGGRPNQQMQQELQAQAPQQGLSLEDAQSRFNQLLNSAETRSQGLVNQYAVSNPALAAPMQERMKQLFDQFRVGQSGPGTTTNQPDSGLANPIAPSGQSQDAAPMQATQGAADPFAKHKALAMQIMSDPQATDTDKAWASKFMPAAPAPAPASAPVLAPTKPVPNPSAPMPDMVAAP